MTQYGYFCGTIYKHLILTLNQSRHKCLLYFCQHNAIGKQNVFVSQPQVVSRGKIEDISGKKRNLYPMTSISQGLLL